MALLRLAEAAAGRLLVQAQTLHVRLEAHYAVLQQGSM
jgi:hypothetical protein